MTGDTESMRLWYHGTKDTAVADKISREGFAASSWFADRQEDAIEFGGCHVFEVMLRHRPVHKGNWQMRVDEAVPPSAIVRRSVFRIEIIEDYPDRRKIVFDSNQGKRR